MDMNPVWIELVPYVSFLAAVAAFGVKIGRLLQKLDTALDDIKLLKIDVKEIKEKMNDHEKRLIILENTTIKISKA
jgi:hypothetical protein